MSSDISMGYDPCKDCQDRMCENKDTWMQCWMDLPVEDTEDDLPF